MEFKLVLASDHYTNQALLEGGAALPEPNAIVVPLEGIPSPELLAQAETAVLVGPIQAPENAPPLAGAFRLAIEQGTVGIYAYAVELLPPDQTFLTRMGIAVRSTGLAEAQPEAVTPEFYRYFARFGVSKASVGSPDIHTVLGLNPSDGNPAAIRAELGKGALYVVPYHVVGGHADFLAELLKAVESHRGGAEGRAPAYLDSLRLRGEDAVLEQIESIQLDLDEARTLALGLERFRMLVGPLHDEALEALVIDALNRVLASTSYRAEDREDVKKEDFWLVNNATRDEFALAEVKGIGSHVRNRDVNQVDNHRGDLGKTPDELPGLLVVNILRNSADLEQKLLPVDRTVVATAKRQNVLVLRGIDLYHLVSRAQDDDETGAQLIGFLRAGGGWLEVSDDKMSLHSE